MQRIKQQKEESEDEFDGLPIASDTDDSEDEVGPSTGRTRRSSREFDAGLILTTPRIVQNTVGQLFEDLESGDIDLEPDYQRNVVWPKEKQSAVIGSLISHFYIPPILFSSRQSSYGGPSFTCIDGKQRLSSIKLFMRNKIPVRDTKSRAFYYCDNPSKKQKGLPPEIAKRFKRETVPTVIYEGLTDDHEREMFQRVQMGVSLSPAEKLSALHSEWTRFCDQLTKKYMNSAKPGANLCHLVRIDRSGDWLVMAQIALCILNSNKVYVPTYDTIRRVVSKDGSPPSDEFKRAVMEAMNRYLILGNDSRFAGALRVGGPPKFSPVEFVHIGYMCWKYPEADYHELASWVQILRTEIREKQYGQVRFNNICATILKERIDSFVPANAGAGASSEPRRQKRARPSEADDQDYYPEMDLDLGGTRSGPNTGRGRQRLSVSGSYATTGAEAPSSSNTLDQSNESRAPAGAADSGRLFRLSASPEGTSANGSQQPVNPANEQQFFPSTWNAPANGSGSGTGSTNFLANTYMS